MLHFPTQYVRTVELASGFVIAIFNIICFCLGQSYDEFIISGLMRAHLSGEKWTGGYLRSLNKRHITAIFCINTIQWNTVELESLPGIKREVSTAAPTAPYVFELENVLNIAGKQLQQIGKRDFAELVCVFYSDYCSN